MAAENKGGTGSGDPVSEMKIEFGEFPYPLSDGPKESPYLTWLRNNSNYMAVRGFLDYLRSVGVLVRGIIVNFLILLPCFLFIAIVLGFAHHSMLRYPFIATLSILALALVWILLFAVMTPIYKIVSHKKSLETGSESSVKQRDLYERSFGGLLLAIVVVAFLEAMPWMLELLNELISSKYFGWQGSLATLVGILALLSGSDKVLSVLSGAKKKLALALIGILSVLVPLLAILFATNFLVYGVPPTPSVMFSPLAVPVVGVVVIMIALVIGLILGAFSIKEFAAVVGLFVAGLLVVAGAIWVGSFATDKNMAGTEESLQRIIAPLDRVAEQFGKISNKEGMDQEVVDLVKQFAEVHRKYGWAMEDLQPETGPKIGTDQGYLSRYFSEESHTGALTTSPADAGSTTTPVPAVERTFFTAWAEIDAQAIREGKQFESGQEFITLGQKLSTIMPRGSLEPLRDEIARLAHDKLLEEIGSGKADKKHRDLLIKSLVEAFIKVTAQQLIDEQGRLDAPIFVEKWEDPQDPVFDVFRDGSKDSLSHKSEATLPNESKASRADEDSFSDILGFSHDRDKWDYARAVFRVQTRLQANSTSNVKGAALKVVESAPQRAADLLQERTVQELAKFVDETRFVEILTDEVKERAKFKELAKLARMLGLPESIDKEKTVGEVVKVLNEFIVEHKNDVKELAERELLRRALPGQRRPNESPKDQRERLDRERNSEEKARVARELLLLAQPANNINIQEAALIKRELELDEQIQDAENKLLKEIDQSQAAEELTETSERVKQLKEEYDNLKKEREVFQEELQSIRFLQLHLSTLAREQLADLVLDGFTPRFLGMLAVLPNLYDQDFEICKETFKALGDRFDERNFHEFKSKKIVAGLAKNADLDRLVKHVFEDSATNVKISDPFSTTTLSDGSFPGVAKLLLLQKALSVTKEDIDRLPKSLRDFFLGNRAANSEREDADGFTALRIAKLAREELIAIALEVDAYDNVQSKLARETLERVYKVEVQRGVKKDDEKVSKLIEFQLTISQSYTTSSSSLNAPRDLLPFNRSELARIAFAKYTEPHSDAPDKLVATLMFGKYGPLERGMLGSAKAELSEAVMLPKAIFVFLLASVIGLGCWLTVDVNLTSIHGLYRDRLASAFLVGEDIKGDVDIEEDIDLDDICRYEARSNAPYHLINVALNLQGSKDPGIRDRNSDFFIFSKRFIGGKRTGYCRTETLEQVFPQMSLATAMAISAAAASPNMGRETSRALVAFFTLLNIRLGYWMPNPGLLEEQQNKDNWNKRKSDAKKAKQKEPPLESDKKSAEEANKPLGFTFEEVFAQELEEIEIRWGQVVDPDGPRRQRDNKLVPTINHGLVGIGFSGGGIRSAAINLGITQALHDQGVFKHVDYMSTVSGGGYLGASISTLMRSRTKLVSEIAGDVEVFRKALLSEFDGTVTIRKGTKTLVVTSNDEKQVRTYRYSADNEPDVEYPFTVEKQAVLIKGRGSEPPVPTETKTGTEQSYNPGDKVVIVTPTGLGDSRTYRFASGAALNVARDPISAGKPLLKPRHEVGISDITGTVSVEHTPTKEQIVKIKGVQTDESREYCFSRYERLLVKTGDPVKPGDALVQRMNSIGNRFRWRVRPSAFLREMCSKLDETHRWVNVSDGGHIENLATIELLRRRCKYIFIGDGEADPKMHFKGLATLIRYARIDLGIEIDIDLGPLCLDENGCSSAHFAIGRITYPKVGKTGEEEVGYLLYLKSSFTGDEDAVIKEYRNRNPKFPHQSTADQFFDEGQFEAYRALGQHIAEQALAAQTQLDPPKKPPARRTAKEKTSAESSVAAKEVTDVGTSPHPLETWFDKLWAAEELRRKSTKS